MRSVWMGGLDHGQIAAVKMFFELLDDLLVNSVGDFSRKDHRPQFWLAMTRLFLILGRLKTEGRFNLDRLETMTHLKIIK